MATLQSRENLLSDYPFVKNHPNRLDQVGDIISRFFPTLLLMVIFIAPVLWNAGSIELTDVNTDYVVEFYNHPQTGQHFVADSFYAHRLKDLIEKSASPSRNPINIIYQHAWYNAVTTGYDLTFWIRPAKMGRTEYGLYLSGNTLFLRLEPDGWNRVLSVPFTRADIEAALEPPAAEEVP